MKNKTANDEIVFKRKEQNLKQKNLLKAAQAINRIKKGQLQTKSGNYINKLAKERIRILKDRINNQEAISQLN